LVLENVPIKTWRMNRRHLIKAIGLTSAWPHIALAQQSPTIRRVAVFLGALTADDATAKLQISTLQDGLRRLGWTEGRDIRFDFRFSRGDPATMAAHVAELVRITPDVIVVQGNRPAALMKQATRTISIGFAHVGDPVGGGLIDNLARPGGNVTGFTHFEASMGGKWLETLKDVAPSVKRAAILMHPTTPANVAFFRVAEAAAPALGVTVTPAGVRDEAEIVAALAAAAGDSAGLAVMPHDVTVAHYRLIVALAAQHRLPAVYPYRYFVTQGGLVSYSFDTVDHWRQVTTYVDRILRGAKPADLPVQAPTKFELVINLKTAKALGITAPPTLLARADEVIE
jgi:putative ABC transport system substrate-binding protein